MTEQLADYEARAPYRDAIKGALTDGGRPRLLNVLCGDLAVQFNIGPRDEARLADLQLDVTMAASDLIGEKALRINAVSGFQSDLQPKTLYIVSLA
jgi:hypothetical protein